MKQFLTIAGAIGVVAAAWLLNNAPSSTETTEATARRAALSVSENVAGKSPDDGAETVPGHRVREDRNCKVELKDYVTTNGEMFSAYSCTPFEPEAGHPYAHYSDDTLEALAYADAEAAAQLGRRLAGKNPDRAYQLLLRATALDGDAQHLAWLADAYYGRYRVDGELQVDNVKRQYEIASIATHFGEDPKAPTFLRDELVNAGVGDDQLGRLDTRVGELLRQIREIQVTVYGEVKTGGLSDA